MAGMFYSIKETAEKLGKTADEVKELVKQGKLREFRDGTSLLFKIDEVEALVAETSFAGAEALAEEPVADELLAEEPAAVEPLAEEPVADELLAEEPAAVEPLAEEPVAAEPLDNEILLLPEEEPDSAELAGAEDELADADTALAGDGVNLLEEADGDYKLADDTMAETKSGTAGAESLEEIEEDVNLDTFGSGSGLLDLSLQADDTSLGGILDEIYTADGEPGEGPAGEGEPADVAAEAEQIIDEEPVGVPSAAEAAVVAAYVEPDPDAASRIFGGMLILPLVVVFYTAIVTAAAQRGVIPSVLQGLQRMIWPIMGGVFVVAAILMIWGSLSAGGAGKSATKPKKIRIKKPKKGKKKKAVQAE